GDARGHGPFIQSGDPRVFWRPTHEGDSGQGAAKKVAMEKDAKYFTAGLFVSLTLLALVVFVIWLAGIHRSGDYARYTIYFSDPVSGLAKDGHVKYKGVDVGKIVALRLS